ncbi:MAG: hypothetical protein B6241_02420 [Spirochaetaceae bacterium 4572_59]|nr:MAG: hypothetical protein B6241_02420 [Spirochaetaceae bacterium 4572_59]
MKEDFQRILDDLIGLTRSSVTADIFMKALGELVNQRIRKEWNHCETRIRENRERRVYYFSAEFLTGRSMRMNLMNAGLWERASELAGEYGYNLTEILEEEAEPGLGNGGLGRLAACFMDSLASLKLPAMGYGIRYRYGLFNQTIKDSRQQESPDLWLQNGDLWGVERPQDFRKIYIGGQVHMNQDQEGDLHFKIDPAEVIHAIPVDYPISGADGKNVATMRLWEARSPEGFNLGLFNREEHQRSWKEEDAAKSLSAVLYPNDQTAAGKQLRLKQQYFFVSASLQDITERFRRDFGDNWDRFSDQHVIQLNDTHPVLAIPELMRLLMDKEKLSWEKAWKITRRTFAYTNHTVLSEALEKWPVTYIQDLFPRLALIIEEIHKRLQNKEELHQIIHNGVIQMAALAIHGSFSVNGVAALHTEILKKSVLKEWYELYPEKFNNKTNGITHRRWLIHSNPALTDLIDQGIGREWHNNPEMLQNLTQFTEDSSFLERLREIKKQNKKDFSKYLLTETGISVNSSTLFDFQVKRLHEYKRQLLNILNIIHRYLRLKDNPTMDLQPRTFFFGGKAAPGYYIAKEIIHLACRVGETLEKDPRCRDTLRLVFLPNYRVSMAERIFPASEVSQQISTAGKEASGTGNMKFMMNGALTLGTMDGANIEIFEKAGLENGYPFGLNADEVVLKKTSYNPLHYIQGDESVKRIFQAIESGLFGAAKEFSALLQHLRQSDQYLVLPELAAHREALNASDRDYDQREIWQTRSLKNIAASGYFSSDRTIREYNRDIWHLKAES